MSLSKYIDSAGSDNAGADINGNPVDFIGGRSTISFHIITENLDAADGEIKVQQSNDGGANWFDTENAGLPIVLPSGNDQNFIVIEKREAKQYRLVYTSNANTTGTIDVYLG